MSFRGRSAVPIALAIFLIPETGSSQGWRLDRQVALELQQSGASQETECAVLYFETGVLSQDQISTFAGLVEKGIEPWFEDQAVNDAKLLDLYRSRVFGAAPAPTTSPPNRVSFLELSVAAPFLRRRT